VVGALSRLLSLLAVQASPIAWDPHATWLKFEPELRQLRRYYPDVRLFLYPEHYLAALGPVSVIHERSVAGAIYNTTVAIGPDGLIRARYRKIFRGGHGRSPRPAASS